MKEEIAVKKVIMGLDVSTKTVGVTIAMLDYKDNLKVLEVTHLRPKSPSNVKGTESLFVKSIMINEGLQKYAKYNITDVIIEEPLIGSNNAETVAVLLRYNGMISQSVYNILGVVPEFISSYEARKYAFPQLMSVRKFKKSGETRTIKETTKSLEKNELVLFGDYSFDCAKKLILWNLVSELYPQIEWQYDDKGELKDENFDASDSLVCVLGYLSKMKYQDTEPVVTSFAVVDEHLIKYTTEFCGKTFDKKIEF